MRPRLVAECDPAGRPGEVDEPTRGERGPQPLRGLVVDQLPAGRGDRRERAEQVIHGVTLPVIAVEKSTARQCWQNPGARAVGPG